MNENKSESTVHPSYSPNQVLTDKEKEAQTLIAKEIDKAMSLLENHLLKFCQETKGTSIPMVYISKSIGILMEGYKKGI